MEYTFNYDYPKDDYLNLSEETRTTHYQYFSQAFEEAIRCYAVKHNTSITAVKKSMTPPLEIDSCIADMVYLLLNDRPAYNEKSMYIINRCYEMENKLAMQRKASHSYKLKLQFFKRIKQQLEFINSRFADEPESAE